MTGGYKRRGSKQPTRIARKPELQALVQGSGVPMDIINNPGALVERVTPERAEALASRLHSASEKVMDRIEDYLAKTPFGEHPKGLKDWTTSMAIMVDKFGVMQNIVLAMDGKAGQASLTDLEKRIALLMAAQAELQRRVRDAEPVDVTPGAATRHHPPGGD